MRLLLSHLVLGLVIFLSAAEAQDDSLEIFYSSPGPWGKLQYHEIILEPPGYRMTISDRFTPPITWDFPEMSSRAVKEKLKQFGFDSAQIARLEKESEWQPSETGTLVFPSDQFIIGMTPNQRRDLYNHLWDRGIDGVTFNIEGRDFKIFETDDFPKDVVSLIQSLSYFRGETRVFSDCALIVTKMETTEQKVNFLKKMARTKALVVKLAIDEDSDLDELASYWSVNPRQKTSLPILRSIRSTEGVEMIDLVHLMPPVGRKYLYTYLQADDAVWSDQPDCYWTAINFSKTTPSKRLLDVGDVGFYLNEDFVPVEPPYKFGDAIVLSDETEKFVHSYVYIADDIVYTKNGKSALYPWIMMRESDMLTRYSQLTTTKRAYRPKTALD